VKTLDVPLPEEYSGPDWEETTEGRREEERGGEGGRGNRSKEGGRERTKREREKRSRPDEPKQDNSHGNITDHFAKLSTSIMYICEKNRTKYRVPVLFGSFGNPVKS
jgi:hypothetical protein